MATDPLAHPEDAIRRVYAYVAYRIGAGADAEDVVSETIERGLRYRHTYDPSAGTPTAWLIGIAKRCIADAMSDAGKRADVDVDMLLGATGDFADEVVGRSDLHAAVARLDHRDRELIALRYGADLKAKEIAKLLEMKTNAVEVALHRCLERLRRKLEEPIGGGRGESPAEVSFEREPGAQTGDQPAPAEPRA